MDNKIISYATNKVFLANELHYGIDTLGGNHVCFTKLYPMIYDKNDNSFLYMLVNHSTSVDYESIFDDINKLLTCTFYLNTRLLSNTVKNHYKEKTYTGHLVQFIEKRNMPFCFKYPYYLVLTSILRSISSETGNTWKSDITISTLKEFLTTWFLVNGKGNNHTISERFGFLVSLYRDEDTMVNFIIDKFINTLKYVSDTYSIDNNKIYEEGFTLFPNAYEKDKYDRGYYIGQTSAMKVLEYNYRKISNDH